MSNILSNSNLCNVYQKHELMQVSLMQITMYPFRVWTGRSEYLSYLGLPEKWKITTAAVDLSC
jgi:hypothetical protein